MKVAQFFKAVVESEEVENEDRDLILWNPAMRMQVSVVTILEFYVLSGSVGMGSIGSWEPINF